VVWSRYLSPCPLSPLIPPASPAYPYPDPNSRPYIQRVTMPWNGAFPHPSMPTLGLDRTITLERPNHSWHTSSYSAPLALPGVSSVSGHSLTPGFFGDLAGKLPSPDLFIHIPYPFLNSDELALFQAPTTLFIHMPPNRLARAELIQLGAHLPFQPCLRGRQSFTPETCRRALASSLANTVPWCQDFLIGDLSPAPTAGSPPCLCLVPETLLMSCAPTSLCPVIQVPSVLS